MIRLPTTEEVLNFLTQNMCLSFLFYSFYSTFLFLCMSFLFILFSRNTAKHDTLRKGSAYPLKDVTLTPCKKQLKHS